MAGASNVSARAAILGAIRQSLGRAEMSADARAELDERIKRHKRNIQPKAPETRTEIVAAFVDKAEVAACTVVRLASDDDVPTALADYLRQHNLPSAVAVAPDAWLTDLPWEREPLLKCRQGAARPDDVTSLTPAVAGVAETGTLVMASGGAHPSSLNFLPDHHVVALRMSQVVAAYEDAWDLLRRTYKRQGGRTVLPRTVNMITGPSRTGDIELTIHLGAHGPRSLHILLIDDEPAQD